MFFAIMVIELLSIAICILGLKERKKSINFNFFLLIQSPKHRMTNIKLQCSWEIRTGTAQHTGIKV